MLDGYMLIQAQDVLQLSDEQFPRFLSRVRARQDTRRVHRASVSECSRSFAA